MNNRNRLGAKEIIPPLVAVGSTVIWIAMDGFTGESIAQALTSLCTMFVILIPIYSHILKKPKETHLESGIRACRAVRNKYPNLITGPKFRKDDYTPGTPHDDHQYLYIQSPKSRRKAFFVAISPFKKAILEIGISQTTLDILNIDKDLADVRKQLHDALLDFANLHFSALFMEKSVEKHPKICIVLDFDIERVTAKIFPDIVRRLLDHGVEVLLKMKSA
jgi:hypothetical protein